MKRLLFNLVTLFSGLACITCAIACIRSRYASDTIGYAGWRNQSSHICHGFGICSSRQDLRLYYFVSEHLFVDPSNVSANEALAHFQARFWNSRQPDPYPIRQFWKRFTYVHRPWTNGLVVASKSMEIRIVTMPDWPVASIAAILPGIWSFLFARRRGELRRRARRGLCAKCGYDLRASIKRCPECGTPIACTTMPNRIIEAV
jgi:hypothetical protein